MRTILLNITSCLVCTVLVLTQKPHSQATPFLKADTISAESQKISFGKKVAYLFPASNIAKVVSYSFLDVHDYDEDSLIKGQLLRIMPKYDQYLRKGDPHPKVILTGAQIPRLLSIINDPKSYRNVTAFCYSPRNCFCFYNNRNEIVGFYEVCFECTRMESVPAFKASKKGGLTDDAADRLKKFCLAAGITVN